MKGELAASYCRGNGRMKRRGCRRENGEFVTWAFGQRNIFEEPQALVYSDFSFSVLMQLPSHILILVFVS